MSSTTPRRLYRSLLREFRLSAKKPRIERNPIILKPLREIVSSDIPSSSLQSTLIETRDFLRASRIHAELLARYNPLHDMTEEERIQATARRVGLDTPVQYKPE